MKTKLLILFIFVSITNLIFSQKQKVEYTVPALEYSYDALEPFIDSTTMNVHYNKHYKGYYTKFLKAVGNTDWEYLTLEEIFASISKAPAFLRNNAGGYYNHKLFWTILTPTKTQPSAALLSAIEKDFNTLDNFKKVFTDAANTVFGSGWVWLILNNEGHLQIVSTANQDNPLMQDAAIKGVPLLNLDVWEHAYYLKYQNRRADYVNAFWNIVNWKQVSKLYEQAK